MSLIALNRRVLAFSPQQISVPRRDDVEGAAHLKGRSSAADFTGVDEGTMENESIGDMLSGEQPSEVIETPVTEPIPEAAVAEPGQPRDEHGRFAPKQETGVTEPAPVAAEPVPPTEQNQLPRDVYEPLKAIRSENQELKQQLASIQHQLMAQRQPAPQPQQPPVDFWEDPQSFMDSRMNQLGEELFQRFEQRQQAQRLDASEQNARAKYADYGEAFAAFEQAVKLNPTLAYELAQAPDPGEFAYNRGKTALAIQNVGSLDELKKQVRAEIEAEARAAIVPARPVLPSTTAGDPSVGARNGPAWTGPTALGDMLR